MKNSSILLSILSLCIICCFACKPDKLEPISADKAAPGPVIKPTFSGLPGAAEIYYTLPDDQNLSYVRAEFEINGVKKEAKSSFYKRSVTVEGFGDTTEHVITLYAVSRSEVPSTPVQIKVRPLPPAIWGVYKSLLVEEAFGGLQVDFTNPDKGKIVVGTLLWNPQQREWRNINNFYYGLDSGSFTIRGLTSVKQLFGIFIKDRWGNVTDTFKKELTPIYEEELNKANFIDIRKKFPIPQLPPLPKSGAKVAEPTNLSSWPFANMFNGIIGNEGFHTTENKDVPIWIPIDLKVKAKLSRYRIWQRQSDYIFNHGNPHEWEIWGTNTPNDVNSWVKFDHRVMEKPSALPLGQKTTEDIDNAAAGEEYEFPLSAPAVRYIAWKHIDSWAAINGTIGHFHLSEMSIWGQIIN
ncbi:MAG TPA: DUF5000 domain-containing lipoprotein [Chitinophaga sp.]|uniref:DUF5000 domain-containing lipoprotein n=1 Tax=Chitinophaga sp. TaxID=1869181 RepID=UPI002BBDEB74|nr:DUF5000 domain-containing lipoprotein [Chitinophaga sp.]HVI47499.1 DUF5000 domain-containing lipoprotein [Chitinophaga sp.]